MYVRAASYGARGAADYLATANQDSLIVVQVEGTRGVANLDAILNVEGVDVAFIGPYDLSQSLGFPGKVRHPAVGQAIAGAIQKARQTGKYIAPIVTTWTPRWSIGELAFPTLPSVSMPTFSFPVRVPLFLA